MAGGSVSSVTRSYATTSSCSEYNYVVSGTGAIYTCCTTDGCNGSMNISSSLILTIVVIVMNSLAKIIIIQ